MVTLADLVILVFLAGLTGKYVFVCILLGFLATYGVLLVKIKKKEKPAEECMEEVPMEEKSNFTIEDETESGNTKPDSPETSKGNNGQSGNENERKRRVTECQEEKPLAGVEVENQEIFENKGKLKNKMEENGSAASAKMEEEESFRFTASVCSTWIPSVVGDQEENIFLKAGRKMHQSKIPHDIRSDTQSQIQSDI